MTNEITPTQYAERYQGRRGLVEGDQCKDCQSKGYGKSIWYYKNAGHRDGIGKCIFCTRNDKAAKEDNQKIEPPKMYLVLNGEDRVFVGRKCSKCGERYQIQDKLTAERYKGARLRGCYACARFKAGAAEVRAERRDLLEDLRRKTWAFLVSSVQRTGYVEVVAKDSKGLAKVKNIITLAEMMNIHSELKGDSTRYVVDHYYPASGEGDYRGMTNIDNLRIITAQENARKTFTIPDDVNKNQYINIADLEKITTYHEANKRLKAWLDTGDFTEAKQAEFKKRQEKLKADVKDIEERVSKNVIDMIYKAYDSLIIAERTLKPSDEAIGKAFSTERMLEIIRHQLQRYNGETSKKLVADYRRRMEIHKQGVWVKTHKPDLETIGLVNYGAVLWCVEATISNIMDGCQIITEQNPPLEKLVILEALKRECAGWALEALENKREIEFFNSPLLQVFSEKIFSVDYVNGKQYLVVSKREKTENDATPFDNIAMPRITPLLRADDEQVLERVEEFENITLEMVRYKAAVIEEANKRIHECKRYAAQLADKVSTANSAIGNEWNTRKEKALAYYSREFTEVFNQEWFAGELERLHGGNYHRTEQELAELAQELRDYLASNHDSVETAEQQIRTLAGKIRTVTSKPTSTGDLRIENPFGLGWWHIK